MDLICYLRSGWAPLIRPASATRAWMDATPHAFAYRCLPLNIANAHGWEMLSPCGFTAVWGGESDAASVAITVDDGVPRHRWPVALFGQGVLTFHIEGIFRTPPGWNLWVSGSPNAAKDGIQALTGIVETDWSPFSFTMNWRFTRPHHPIRFEAGEPMCFLFPVERAALERFRPLLAPLDGAPETKQRFEAWSAARDTFHEVLKTAPPEAPSESWQKHYYRGVDVAGERLIEDHQTKLRLAPFREGIPPADPPPLQAPRSAAAMARLERDLARRDWLLRTMERQRMLSPKASHIERRYALGREEFLDRYYAPGRPVILVGEIEDWPARIHWTADYLRAAIGDKTVEFQAGRTRDPGFERDKDRHRESATLAAFLDRIEQADSGNELYLTAYNSAANAAAFRPLAGDLGRLDKFLKLQGDLNGAMLWIGPAGTFTPLHHDLTNNLIVQLTGRKHIRLLPASEVGQLYNDAHVFSAIGDLDDPALDRARFAKLHGARVFDLILEPGEILYVPLAWWHQVRALDFSVTATYTNFLWPNGAAQDFPPDP